MRKFCYFELFVLFAKEAKGQHQRTTDDSRYNDVVFAQDVYRYKPNIVIAMIFIVRVARGLPRPYIVIRRISL